MFLTFLFSAFVFQADTDSVKVNAPKPVAVQTDSCFTIKSIIIIGNKVTKRHIVMRELSFTENDTICATDLQKHFTNSTQNLNNTLLFNFVKFDTFDTRGNETKVAIRLTERWYTWPVPIFELADRNFNVWWETKDLTRVNYGFFLNRENFRGRKERFIIVLRLGYSEQYGFMYNAPYLNKKQTIGGSFTFAFGRNHEINYGSGNNRQLFFRDEEKYIRQELSSKINVSYRKGIYNTFSSELRYFKGTIGDTITKIADSYFINDLNNTRFLALNLYARSDHRDFKPYPLKGYYADVDITQTGLGIFKEEKNLNITFLTATYKYFFQLSKRWFFAASARGKISSKTNQPYYVQRGLGYRDNLRGYEYYIIDGQHYGLLRTNFKYQILKKRTLKTNIIGTEKFNTFHLAVYANAYADAGYVIDNLYKNTNPLANQALYSFGSGIDFVTYYDIVLRLEYSFTKKLEHGFFIHFAAPI
jgi:outer membrane protein assembly factor BamA